MLHAGGAKCVPSTSAVKSRRIRSRRRKQHASHDHARRVQCTATKGRHDVGTCASCGRSGGRQHTDGPHDNDAGIGTNSAAQAGAHAAFQLMTNILAQRGEGAILALLQGLAPEAWGMAQGSAIPLSGAHPQAGGMVYSMPPPPRAPQLHLAALPQQTLGDTANGNQP